MKNYMLECVQEKEEGWSHRFVHWSILIKAKNERDLWEIILQNLFPLDKAITFIKERRYMDDEVFATKASEYCFENSYFTKYYFISINTTKKTKISHNDPPNDWDGWVPEFAEEWERQVDPEEEDIYASIHC